MAFPEARLQAVRETEGENEGLRDEGRVRGIVG